MDAEGELLARNPLDYLVPSFNASERPYFKAVSSQLGPIISEPYSTALEGEPAVTLAAPLSDPRRRCTGMIRGLILLDRDNLLGHISGGRVGPAGCLRLITRQGVVLADGRDGRVMVPADARQSSIVRAMEGFEGTLRDESDQQMPTITAYGQMAQVPWFVAAVWPETDAFASVNRMRDAFSWTLLSVLVVLVPLAFWFFHRLLRPLRDLSLQIYQRHTGERQMPVSEIGGRAVLNVVRVVNMVRHERVEILRSLAELEAFFRSLTQDAPIGILHSNILRRIEFVNPAL